MLAKPLTAAGAKLGTTFLFKATLQTLQTPVSQLLRGSAGGSVGGAVSAGAASQTIVGAMESRLLSQSIAGPTQFSFVGQSIVGPGINTASGVLSPAISAAGRASGPIVGEACKGSVRSINPTAVEQAGTSVRNWLGEGAIIKSSPSGFVLQSKDGLRQLRLDLAGHGKYPPHSHLQVRSSPTGKFVDAKGTPHHIYFSDTAPPTK